MKAKTIAENFRELSEKEKELVNGGSVLTSYACSGPAIASSVASVISGLLRK